MVTVVTDEVVVIGLGMVYMAAKLTEDVIVASVFVQMFREGNMSWRILPADESR